MIRSVPAAENPFPHRRGYDAAWFDVLAAVEERHFWFRARNRVITAAIRSIQPELPGNARVLEVGCGNGNVLRVLERLFPRGAVTGLDLFEAGLERARGRCGCRLVAGDLFDAPFPEGSFEVIGMFDVLEHLADDGRALGVLRSLLAPGGFVVLTVPACPALWSGFDEVAGHFRRYTGKELRTRLSGAGFEVIRSSGFMTTIFPLVYFARRGARVWRGRDFEGDGEPRARALDELRVRPVLNALLFHLLRWESAWIDRGGNLPAGASIVAIARKPFRHSTES